MSNAHQPSNCNLFEQWNEEEKEPLLLGLVPPAGSGPIGQGSFSSSDRASDGPHLRGQWTGGESGVTSSAQKRKASEAESNSESEVTREIIHDWTDKGNISFEYTQKKANELVKKAKEKMKKSNCDQLECTQCNESFPSEDELRKHFVSEEHLAKVREKSESKTLGDLKLFAGTSQLILSRVMETSVNHHCHLYERYFHGDRQTQEIFLHQNQPAPPAADTEVSKVKSCVIIYSCDYF